MSSHLTGAYAREQHVGDKNYSGDNDVIVEINPHAKDYEANPLCIIFWFIRLTPWFMLNSHLVSSCFTTQHSPYVNYVKTLASVEYDVQRSNLQPSDQQGKE